MSLFEQIQHVSITVTDVEKARDFYTRTLGLQEIPRPAFDCSACLRTGGAVTDVGRQRAPCEVTHGVCLHAQTRARFGGNSDGR